MVLDATGRANPLSAHFKGESKGRTSTEQQQEPPTIHGSRGVRPLPEPGDHLAGILNAELTTRASIAHMQLLYSSEKTPTGIQIMVMQAKNRAADPMEPAWSQPPRTLPADIVQTADKGIFRVDAGGMENVFHCLVQHPGLQACMALHPIPRGDGDVQPLWSSADGRVWVGGDTNGSEVHDADALVNMAAHAPGGMVHVALAQTLPPAWSAHLERVNARGLPPTPRRVGSRLLDACTSLQGMLNLVWEQRQVLRNKDSLDLLHALPPQKGFTDAQGFVHALSALEQKAAGMGWVTQRTEVNGYTVFLREGKEEEFAFQVYVNAKPDCMVQLARALLDNPQDQKHLAGFQVAGKSHVNLASNMMVYARDVEGLREVLGLLSSMQRAHPEWLQTPAHPVTQQVAPGISYAQKPSLRQTDANPNPPTPTRVRGHAILQALKDTLLHQGDREDFGRHATDRLLEHNVDPQAPHLNRFVRSA